MMSTATQHRFDPAVVKVGADWPEIFAAVGGIDRTLLDGRHHPCPKQCGGDAGGTDRFRLIDAKAGALFCNGCFSEKNGDGLAAIQWLRGCSFSEALQLVAEHRGMAPSSSNGSKPADVDIVERVARLKKMPVESYRAFGAKAAMRGKMPVARVPVYNELGEEFSYFDLNRDGNKGWFKKGAGTSGVFLIDARPPQATDTVVITEGFKDACAWHAMGYKVVGLPADRLDVKHARLFRNCTVFVAMDRNDAGLKATKKIAPTLYGVAANVYIVTLPTQFETKGGDDARDIYHKKDGEKLLRQAIEDAVPWEPAQESASTSRREDRKFTDLGNAHRLVDQHSDDIRFCHPWKTWQIWNGKRWATDTTGEINRRAEDTIRAMYRTAEDLTGDQRETLIKHALKSEHDQRISAMIRLARSREGVPVDPDALDADLWLLNCINGTIDLRTGELRKHLRNDLLTKICPVEFQPAATCPMWESYLRTVLGDDEPLIEFLRRAVGYSLTGSVAAQVLFFLHGDGSNGKSVFLETIQALLGNDFAMTAANDLLMAKKASHPTAIADLHGKRLVVAIETGEDRRLDEPLVKQLTGSDRLRARRMKENFWEFQPTHKIWLASNHKPDIRGTDHAIWRRIKLVPFTVTIPDEEQDTALAEKLKAELPGILAWAVEGCLRWQQDGLSEPEKVKVATANYRTEMDVLARFIEDCCVVNKDAWVASADLYPEFQKWAKRENEKEWTGNRFGRRLTKKGFTSERLTAGSTKGRNFWLGIGLVDASRSSEGAPSESF